MELPGAWLLLAPAGLLGLIALAIPVAIHLISRGRGRRVLVGNIELVRAARQTRVTALRLTEWLLLLLRLLIVVVAALLLARLAQQGIGTADDNAGYVTPGWLASATDAERSELLSREPAARVLTAGYPPVPDFDSEIVGPDYDAWPLLAERLSTLRHTGTVDVYAESSMSAFGSHRPKLPYEIEWHLASAQAKPEVLASRGLVVHDPARAGDLLRIERALSALKRHRVPQMQWDACPVGDESCGAGPLDWIVWLADAEPPGDIDAARLYRPEGPEWRQATTDPRYPDALLDELLGDAGEHRSWQRIAVSAEILNVGMESPGPIPLPHRPAHAWLGLLLAVLWGIERLISERRRNAGA